MDKNSFTSLFSDKGQASAKATNYCFVRRNAGNLTRFWVSPVYYLLFQSVFFLEIAWNNKDALKLNLIAFNAIHVWKFVKQYQLVSDKSRERLREMVYYLIKFNLLRNKTANIFCYQLCQVLSSTAKPCTCGK